MDNIKVSVIVPVYNAEKYLKRCVDSLLAQTYSNIEIILVNDGSTDSSPMICDEYKSDNRVVVIHQENKGLAAARNKGLKNATGDYIGFVDADDFVKEDMFEVLLSTAVDNDCDMVNCGHFEVEEDGTVLRECTDTHGFTPNELVPQDDLVNRIKEILNDNLLWFLWRNLYKTEFLNKYNITYCEEDVVEDSLFNLDCLLNNPRIVFIDIPLYYYVMSDNSLTRSKGKNGYVRRLENTYYSKLKIYKSHGILGFEDDINSYTLNHILPMLIGNILSLKHPYFEIDAMFSSDMVRSSLNSGLSPKVSKQLGFMYKLIKNNKKLVFRIIIMITKYFT